VLDLGIDLNVWPWMWLGIGVVFAIIELTLLPGSFVILPFALSAFAASIAGFYDVSIELQWLIFVVGGGGLWVLMYRYARRWVDDNAIAPGVGAARLVGLHAIVTRTIDPDDTDRQGRVSVNGEIWGALTETDAVLEAGTKVVITEVNGTRVVVRADSTLPPSPPISPSPPTPPTAGPTTSPTSPPPFETGAP
jgi:membrane protein implicated in regulation of membrane protease activity